MTSQYFLDKLIKQDKIKNFSEMLSLDTSLNRELQIADIDEEIGEAVETLIRFWNRIDKENGVAIQNREPIKIYINSNGGDLHATFTMIDAIQMYQTPVYTINIGTAFSGGFFTFIAGHKRFAYPNATFLYHEGSTGGGRQDAGKFRNYASFYENLMARLQKITLKYTNITEEEYEKHRNDDWWIFADEAIEKGICDEIINDFIS